MIQQTANQFSEGMNLDTHPIAINNQQLASALNATMITMNGNELVLQNDMGNGKVESAYLPAGYVPVGMTEFGGIIYVASHNPLTGQSQIGSFPSPERNISSDEISNGANKVFQRFSALSKVGDYPYLKDNELYITSLAQKLGIKADDPIRPGDKFSIEMENDEEFVTLLKLLDIKALNLYPCTINSDGAFVKIEDLIEDYDYWVKNNTVSNQDNGGQKYSSFVFCRNIGNDRRYNVYKNKIVGDLYLKLDVGVPDNIPYYILADTNNGVSEYTILMPQLPNISKYRVYVTTTDGQEYWIDTDQQSFEHQFVIGSQEGTSENIDYFYGSDIATHFYTVTYQFNDLEKKGIIHNYTIVPYFKPGSNTGKQLNIEHEALEKNSGYLISMATKGSIDLSKLGKGIINFNSFRYYNNTNDGIFTLSYSMETYLKSSQFVSEVDLCTIDYTRLLDDEGKLSTSAVTLSEGDGLYSTVIGTSKISYFGNFQQSISYSDPELKIGKTYIGFLRAKIQTTVNNKIDYKYSKPFILFTSSISNYLFSSNMEQYVDAATGNNPVDQQNNPKQADEANNILWDDYIGIPCNINWKYSVKDNTTTTTDASGYTLPFDSESDIVYYTQTKTGTIDYTLNPVIDLRFGNDFPLDTTKVSASFYENSIQVDEDETTYSYEAQLVGTHNNTNLDNMLKSPAIEQNCNRSQNYTVSYDSTTRTLSCNTKIVAQFEAGVISVQDETINGNAFLPLLQENIRHNVLQQDLFVDSDEDPKHYEATIWFNMRSRDGAGSHSSWRESGIVDLWAAPIGDGIDLPYSYATDAGHYYPLVTSGNYTSLKHSEYNDPSKLSWINYIRPFEEEYRDKVGQAPLIAFTQGVRTDPDSQGDGHFNSGEGCVPMLLDTAGIYRPIEDIGYGLSYDGHKGYISNLVERYKNNGLIVQENQVYQVSYKYTNSGDIIYSQPYQCTYNVKVRGNTRVSLGDQFPQEAIIKTNYQTISSDTETTTSVTIQVLKQGSEYQQLKDALSQANTYQATNAVKLPKAALIDKNNYVKVVDETVIPISVNSPDIEEQVAIFLSSNHADQNMPAIIEDTLIGNVDVENKILSSACMYFLGNDGKLYSSDLLSKMTKVGQSYKATIDGVEYIFNNQYADSYVKISKSISKEVIKIYKDEAYNIMYGLYVNYSKASTVGDIINQNSGRTDDIGQLKDSMVGKWGGVNTALVGKANGFTPYNQW